MRRCSKGSFLDTAEPVIVFILVDVVLLAPGFNSLTAGRTLTDDVGPAFQAELFYF